MKTPRPESSHPPQAARQFATTHWSLVVAAGGGSDESRRALAELCELYWYPLYAYIRRRGIASAEAQDLTQAFFAELLEKERLRAATPDRGRFRSFLLASLNHFLANQWRDARRQKRGGDRTPLSIDYASAESRYQWEPADDETAERTFERRWAMTLLSAALDRLRDECDRQGKLPLFERLKAYLAGEPDAATYRQIAEELAMSEGAVKTAAHRLRSRGR
ncbi:MAG: sigma-70 family RNA polymerase sigma factor, partial [Pirellulaceae bacterium]